MMDRILRTGNLRPNLPLNVLSHIWRFVRRQETRAAEVITALLRRVGAIGVTVRTWEAEDIVPELTFAYREENRLKRVGPTLQGPRKRQRI